MTLTCFAFLVSLGRFFYNRHHNTRPFLEDGLLLAAILCLVVESGCLYSYKSSLYLIDAKALHSVFSEWVQDEEGVRAKLDEFRPARILLSSVFAWISIFAVKFSCLAFFVRVSGNTSKSLRVALRVALAFTAMSGLVIFILLFLQCPHFHEDASKLSAVWPRVFLDDTNADEVKCITRETWAPSLSIAVVEQVLNNTTTLMSMLTMLKVPRNKN